MCDRKLEADLAIHPVDIWVHKLMNTIVPSICAEVWFGEGIKDNSR